MPDKEKFHELTDKDLSIFKTEFNKWADLFGIKGWSVSFKLKELSGCFGTLNTNCVGRVATITLAKFMDQDLYSIDQVKKTAFHECCELFLARINALAMYRHTTADEIEEEIHNIIRTVENLKDKLIGSKKANELTDIFDKADKDSKDMSEIKLSGDKSNINCYSCETNIEQCCMCHNNSLWTGDTKIPENQESNNAKIKPKKNLTIDKSCKNCGRHPKDFVGVCGYESNGTCDGINFSKWIPELKSPDHVEAMAMAFTKPIEKVDNNGKK